MLIINISMKKLTLFETQANNRKKDKFIKTDSKEFEEGKAIYFDYWPPMESQLALLQIDKKPIKFKS